MSLTNARPPAVSSSDSPGLIEEGPCERSPPVAVQAARGRGTSSAPSSVHPGGGDSSDGAAFRI